MATMTAATTIPDAAIPRLAIRETHMGGNKIPPKLAPLSARLKAFGRSRSNQRATMALMAALLVVAQPAPLSSAAGRSYQGEVTTDQVMMPRAHDSAPIRVTFANGYRRCNSGR